MKIENAERALTMTRQYQEIERVLKDLEKIRWVRLVLAEERGPADRWQTDIELPSMGLDQTGSHETLAQGVINAARGYWKTHKMIIEDEMRKIGLEF